MKKKLTLPQMQALQLNMAKFIHNICEANDIKYFMVSGTLLGAVRHKGFIPWDYDIDFGMLREDYDKFVSVCKAGALGDKFVLINNEAFGEFEFPITRIGAVNTYSYDSMRDHIKDCKFIYVDIIPFDNVPDDEESRISHKKEINRLRKIIYYRTGYKYNGLIIKRIAAVIRSRLFRLISLSSLINSYEKQLRLYDGTKTAMCGALAGRYDYDKEAMPSDYFEKRILMPFEDTYLWGLERYNDVLTHLYGDYMKLPPKEEQYVKFDAYIIDTDDKTVNS